MEQYTSTAAAPWTLVEGNDKRFARVMRKNRVHHLVVTHEKTVVGIISSFDLLKLVEDKRFVAKNAPDQGKHQRRSAS